MLLGISDTSERNDNHIFKIIYPYWLQQGQGVFWGLVGGVVEEIVGKIQV
jgi:hypothetical protein